MKYVIDIDGVIGKKLKWSIGDSYLRAKETFMDITVDIDVISKINKLHEEGNVIILHTSRLWHDYDVTVEWLKRYNVKYNVLIMAKPLGDFYIDDKNMTVKEFLEHENHSP